MEYLKSVKKIKWCRDFDYNFNEGYFGDYNFYGSVQR